MSTDRSGAVLACLAVGAVLAGPGLAGDWPQWRGPQRDGHADPREAAVTRLPGELKPLWRIVVGAGFSSPIVAGGKVVYLDTQEGKEVAHAADARSGRELWRQEVAAAFGDEWGTGPRSTPFTDGERVFVQSCSGEFQCLALEDGRLKWRTNFEEFGVKFLGNKAREGTASRRGNNGSGVADSRRVYVPVGSTHGATVVAFDKVSGRVLWKALDDEAAYSSLMLGAPGGVPQVLAFTADHLAGLEPESGRVLWRVPFRTAAKRHAATPVVAGDLVVVNSQTIGLAATRLSRAGDSLQAAPAWNNKPLKINLSTPVLFEGHLYCHGASKDYVCVDAQTGVLKWSQPGFGRGTKDYCSSILVGRNLLVLAESGQLVLLAARPDRCLELGRLQVCGSTWSHPAFAEGRLYVRDERELKCIDLTPP